MAIDGVVASRSIITNKLGKYMGPLQHINITSKAGAAHATPVL
jgi:hypothetical protein